MDKMENYKAWKLAKIKRGQIEIFGLAVIVILVTIGFFIYASIKSQEPQTNVRNDFTSDKLASDFVLSIVDTSVYPCTQYTVKDLVVDCARDRRLRCGIDDSCVALNKSINVMLNRTFMTTYKYKFRFYSQGIHYNGTELFNISYMGCTKTSPQGRGGTSIISLYPAPGNAYLNMNICY